MRQRHLAVIALTIATGLGADLRAMDVEPWTLPSMHSTAGYPDLIVDGDGRLLLSWIEKGSDGRHRLQWSRHSARQGRDGAAQSQWSLVKIVATGNDWFVNWADAPHIVALADGTLWAHWLRRNAPGSHDYGIALTRSLDDGKTWSAEIRVDAGTPNSYSGFVSLWPQSHTELGVAWLDGRHKHGHDHDSGDGGSMMLRAAIFGADGKRSIEWPLDPSTCDCCTTSAASTSRGAVVTYRGRSAGEVRDTRLVRHDGEKWTAPMDVHMDGWRFAGCPVNGPVVVASDKLVWVAWYTEAAGQPSLLLARSGDAGDHFDKPLTVADGPGVLGRAALAMEGDAVWIAWLEERAGLQQLWLARADARAGKILERQHVHTLAARGRSSGLPKLQASAGAAWLVWTDVDSGRSVLKGLSARAGSSVSTAGPATP